MTGIPTNNKREKLPKSKRNFVRNIRLDHKNPEKMARDVEYMLKELATAIVELQKIQVVSDTTDSDNTPQDGARCELLDGQFVKVVQTAVSPQNLKYAHKLDRVPQGGISLTSSGFNFQVVVPGIPSLSIAPASREEVTIILKGNIGDTHTLILF